MKRELASHVMTGILCVCALAVTGMSVRQQFFTPAVAGAGQSQTTIKNWKDFRSGHPLGVINRPVSLVVFSDYECPACRSFSKIVDSLRATYPTQLSVYYRNLPLPSHPFARPASFAAECAALQDRFAEAHRLLFRDPDSNGTRQWAAFARQVGIADTTAFTRCMRDSLPVTVVKRDEADAQRLGVHVTPTLLLDDQLIDGARTFAHMDEMMRKQLGK
jgi:protein-disulfide isomerase